jgi:hypothetical protein
MTICFSWTIAIPVSIATILILMREFIYEELTRFYQRRKILTSRRRRKARHHEQRRRRRSLGQDDATA